MLAIERKNEILELLQAEQKVLVAELSQKYHVTEETIRRDLDKLEKEGLVKKTYGGAVLNKANNVEMPLRIREKTNRQEKQKIAAAVAALMNEGDRIMLDASSTSLMIAQYLKNVMNLPRITVITNSVEVLIELSGSPNIKVISTGGNLVKASLSLVGKEAESLVEKYNVDKVIISCEGLSMDKGVSDSDELEASLKLTMCTSARSIILAADSSKFGNISFVNVLPLEKVDILVTDQLPDEAWQEYLREKKVKVVLAS